jgi:CelD/BcsL family acetyltransferase involved in cellulose biosynthesis
MLTIEEITNVNKLPELEEVWKKILDVSKCDNVFLTYEWITVWLSHFWKDKPILFLLIKNEKDPIGLVPLLVDGEKEVLMFPVNGHTYRPNLIFGGDHEELLKILFAHLRKRVRRVNLCLHEVELDSFLAKTLPNVARECRIVTVFKKVSSSPFLSINTDWQNFLNSKSKHFREEQKRKVSKMRKTGQLDFVKVSNPDQIHEVMRDVLIIERNSWKEKEGTSFTAVPGLQEFYLDVAEAFAKRQCLCIYLVYFNSVPIAHLFGIVYENRYYALKTSYDESYKELSPGAVLFNYALQDIFQSNLKEFDFLGVESRWKNEIASDTRNLVNVFVYPKSIPYFFLGYLENTIKPLIREKAPFVLNLKRKFQKSLRDEKSKEAT